MKHVYKEPPKGDKKSGLYVHVPGTCFNEKHVQGKQKNVVFVDR